MVSIIYQWESRREYFDTSVILIPTVRNEVGHYLDTPKNHNMSTPTTRVEYCGPLSWSVDSQPVGGDTSIKGIGGVLLWLPWEAEVDGLLILSLNFLSSLD